MGNFVSTLDISRLPPEEVEAYRNLKFRKQAIDKAFGEAQDYFRGELPAGTLGIVYDAQDNYAEYYNDFRLIPDPVTLASSKYKKQLYKKRLDELERAADEKDTKEILNLILNEYLSSFFFYEKLAETNDPDAAAYYAYECLLAMYKYNDLPQNLLTREKNRYEAFQTELDNRMKTETKERRKEDIQKRKEEYIQMQKAVTFLLENFEKKETLEYYYNTFKQRFNAKYTIQLADLQAKQPYESVKKPRSSVQQRKPVSEAAKQELQMKIGKELYPEVKRDVDAHMVELARISQEEAAAAERRRREEAAAAAAAAEQRRQQEAKEAAEAAAKRIQDIKMLKLDAGFRFQRFLNRLEKERAEFTSIRNFYEKPSDKDGNPLPARINPSDSEATAMFKIARDYAVLHTWTDFEEKWKKAQEDAMSFSVAWIQFMKDYMHQLKHNENWLQENWPEVWEFIQGMDDFWDDEFYNEATNSLNANYERRSKAFAGKANTNQWNETFAPSAEFVQEKAKQNYKQAMRNKIRETSRQTIRRMLNNLRSNNITRNIPNANLNPKNAFQALANTRKYHYADLVKKFNTAYNLKHNLEEENNSSPLILSSGKPITSLSSRGGERRRSQKKTKKAKRQGRNIKTRKH